jgi:hypothetical protein
MRRAGDFIPYEGTVVLNPNFPRNRWDVCMKLNVGNATAELATAGAIIQRAEIVLLTGVVTLTMGSPPRVPMSAVVGRYSGASPKDNIVNLTP